MFPKLISAVPPTTTFLLFLDGLSPIEGNVERRYSSIFICGFSFTVLADLRNRSNSVVPFWMRRLQEPLEFRLAPRLRCPSSSPIFRLCWWCFQFRSKTLITYGGQGGGFCGLCWSEVPLSLGGSTGLCGLLILGRLPNSSKWMMRSKGVTSHVVYIT